MTLEEYIKVHKTDKLKSESFCDYLFSLMNKHKIDKPSELYKKAFISRQLFSAIISNKSTPSINVCIKLALALKLTNRECKYLLKKAGFTLASSSNYSLIIRYALDNSIYDIDKVNDMLILYGYSDSLLK